MADAPGAPRSTSAPRADSIDATSRGNSKRFCAPISSLTRPGASPCASAASLAGSEMTRSASPYSRASTISRAARAAGTAVKGDVAASENQANSCSGRPL